MNTSTPMFSELQHLYAARIWLASGARADSTCRPPGPFSFYGCTPLQQAGTRLDWEMVDVLLKCDANRNAPVAAMSALSTASTMDKKYS